MTDKETKISIEKALRSLCEEIAASFSTMFDHHDTSWAARLHLAKELGLCYAAVSVVVNMATGMEDGAVDLEYGDGDGVIRDAMQCLRLILKDTLLQPLDQNQCGCSDALIHQ